ncbi:hypothetical protein DXG01_010488 [Tephrocybe rancida]|nr:hypothetical protein DXG01_010488 [Tephrocybe rancida]
MPASKGATRDQQPYTGAHGGLGLPFSSPIKRSNPKKPARYVAPLGNSHKHRRVAQELEALQAVIAPQSQPGSVLEGDIELIPAPTLQQEPELLPELSEVVTDDPGSPFQHFPESEPPPITPRRIVPNRAAKNVTGQDYMRTPVHFCECQDLTTVLVSNGLFPTAPSQPRMAVSIHLLDFYGALFERSCDAVNALAGALNTFYKRHGFILVNAKGDAVQDPFRKGLGHAIQWYDNLQVYIEQIVEAAIVSADARNRDNPDEGSMTRGMELFTLLQPPEQDRPRFGPVPPPQPLSECARILQKRCPACFGGTTFGWLFDDGADIHICVDGNFNHRHLKSSGDCPPFYEPEYMLPKSLVDSAGDRIEGVRRNPPKPRQPALPDEAVDECESTHVAGSGSNSKTNMEKFDDGGVMALVCWHDIPLFLANIDTPGEQQKYSVALIEHLYSLLPSTATVAILYDVGCVLDRSCQLYNILPNSIVSRLLFATSAMHAYVHEWACQIVYNPRLHPGLGLTDGEGVERLWSRLRKLIGITRSSHRRRQVRFIGVEHQEGLGAWIKRRLVKGVEGQAVTARKVLQDCGVSVDVLRAQWSDQRETQLSIRAHAPARLKKELDSVLSLQGQMEGFDQAIHTLRAELSKADAPQTSLKLLASLQEMQEEFKERGEALYSSLNVHGTFPELQHVDLDFVCVLLTARDLKINIRKRAIGSFLEWDKLDQAAGGREQSLGTKLHQSTRSAIAKRAPALMNAIRKFNGYCSTLAAMHKDNWSIPLPHPLPVKLAELRESSLLMEDIWISKTPGERPQWLAEPKVHEGICAVLKIDRCLEEQWRLGMEADNICRWFGRELHALQTALASTSSTSSFVGHRAADSTISMPLQQQRNHLLFLKRTWSSPLASAERFEAHVVSASATTAVGAPVDQYLTWMPAVVRLGNDDLLDNDEDPPTDAVIFVGGKETMETSLLDQGSSAPTHGEDGEDNTPLVDFILEAEGAGDDLVDDKVTDPPTMPVEITWMLPRDHHVDSGLLERLKFYTFADFPPSNLERVLHHGGIRTYFDTKCISIMSSPSQLLNDSCINGIATLLHSHFSDRNNPASSSSSRFAAQAPWGDEIKDVCCFIERLVVNANRHGHELHVVTEEGWTARPVLLRPCQTNGYDCGVWVLATIAAVLCGFHCSGLLESDMQALQSLILRHILALPVYNR